MMIRVFIDTNTIKFSATKQLRIIPINKAIRNWYGKITSRIVSTIGYINPNEKLKNGSELKQEAKLLIDVAELAKNSHIELYEDVEMIVESMGLPNIGSSTGRLYKAPISRAEAPIKYGRMIMGPSYMGSPKEMTLNFLKNINERRFKDLQKITGAYQGGDKYNINQLRDAFLIWSAEHNECDYFLTLDFKLIKMVKRDNKYEVKVNLVRPSELLQAIDHE